MESHSHFFIGLIGLVGVVGVEESLVSLRSLVSLMSLRIIPKFPKFSNLLKTHYFNAVHRTARGSRQRFSEIGCCAD